MTSLIGLLGLLSLFSCAHSVHQVATDVALNPGNKSGKLIKASGEQFVILGMVTQTNYVEAARDELLKQCPQGAVSPLTTKYMTDLGFLSWTNRIELEGNCLP
jgi:hypothetical protein